MIINKCESKRQYINAMILNRLYRNVSIILKDIKQNDLMQLLKYIAMYIVTYT